MKSFLALIWLLLSSFPVLAQDEEPKFPDNQGAVNDFANILSDETKTEIRSLAATLRDSGGACVVVVTTPSLYGLLVEDYTSQLFKKWKIGRADKNDGIILLVAPNERKSRIEVGYGLEHLIPDAIAKRIQAESIRPFLKNNQWNEGILSGTKAIIAKLNGTAEGAAPVTPEPYVWHSKPPPTPWYLTWWGMIVILVGIVLLIIIVVNDPTGLSGAIIGGMMNSSSGGGWSSGGGGGGGGGSRESSSSRGGDSGGGGASDSF